MDSDKGFTIIELLVVIFIFIVVFGLAALKFNFGATRELETYAKQLKSYLFIAKDEAVFKQQIIAFVAKENTMQFFAYNHNNKKWRLLSKKERFWRDKQFPQYIELSLAGKNNKILIYPDGELSVFTLSFKNNKDGTFLLLSHQNKSGINISSVEKIKP